MRRFIRCSRLRSLLNADAVDFIAVALSRPASAGHDAALGVLFKMLLMICRYHY